MDVLAAGDVLGVDGMYLERVVLLWQIQVDFVTGFDVTGTDVTGGDVTGTDVKGTDVTGADVTGTEVDGAIWSKQSTSHNNQSLFIIKQIHILITHYIFPESTVVITLITKNLDGEIFGHKSIRLIYRLNFPCSKNFGYLFQVMYFGIFRSPERTIRAGVLCNTVLFPIND